jgi:hypothetical protein
MNKVTITTRITGEEPRIVEKELTDDEMKRFRLKMDAMKEAKQKMHDKIAERMSKIPPVHFEILKEANKVSKEELLVRYPEHAEFITTIQ